MRLLKSLSIYVLLFGILVSFCGPAAAAEKRRLHPISTWTICDTDVFKGVFAFISQENTDKYDFSLPREIDSHAFSGYMRVTDGNDEWKIMVMTPMTPDFTAVDFDTVDFRKRLEDNYVLSFLMKSDKFRFLKRDGMLYIVSHDLPEELLEELNPGKKFTQLAGDYKLAYLDDNNIEWKLLPVLPPEKKDEGEFIKNVREERTKNKLAKPDGNESVLVGIRWDDNGKFKFDIVTTNAESPDADSSAVAANAQGFGLGGFLSRNKDDLTSGAFRLTEKSLCDSTMSILLQFSYIKPEERKTPSERYSVRLDMGMHSTQKEDLEFFKKSGKGFYTCFGNLLTYDGVVADTTFWKEEKNVASAEELNRSTAEVFRSLDVFFHSLDDAAKNSNKEMPFDIAWQTDDAAVFAGISMPAGVKSADWSTVEYVRLALNIIFEKSTGLDENQNLKKCETELKYSFTNIETDGDIKYSKCAVSFKKSDDANPFPLLIARGDDLLCVVIPDVALSNLFIEGESKSYPALNDFVNARLPELKKKIADSKRLKGEKIKVPSVMFSFNHGGKSVKIANKTEGPTNVLTFEFDHGSLPLLALAQQLFAKDYFQNLLNSSGM